MRRAALQGRAQDCGHLVQSFSTVLSQFSIAMIKTMTKNNFGKERT